MPLYRSRSYSPKPGTIKPTVTPRQRFLSRGADRVSKQSIRRGHWRSPAGRTDETLDRQRCKGGGNYITLAKYIEHWRNTLTERTTSDWQTNLGKQLASQPPFSCLDSSDLMGWVQSAERMRYEPGERLIRPDEINSKIFLVLKGSAWLIAYGDKKEGPFTLDKRGPGQLVGWTSLLRGAPTEFVQASSEVVALALPGNIFIRFIQEVPAFATHFFNLTNQQEAYAVAVAAAELQPKRSANWRDGLLERVQKTKTVSLKVDQQLQELETLPTGWNWHLSTPDIPGVAVGTTLTPISETLPRRPGFLLPYRIIALPEGIMPTQNVKISDLVQKASEYNEPPIDLQQLGILEEDNLHDEARNPVVRGRGRINETLAICEMIALHQQVPFRRDAIQKVLDSQFRREKV